MQSHELAIPILFLILASLVLWYVIDVRGKWWLKLILIVVIPLSSITVWKSLDSYSGWPTSDILPEKAMLLWAVVAEPNAATGDAGAVYLWAVSEEEQQSSWFLFRYKPAVFEPRVYRLEYSRKLHEKIERARDLLKMGKEVMVGRDAKDGESGTDKEGEDKKGVKASKGGYGIAKNYEPKFYELPPLKMPRKEVPSN